MLASQLLVDPGDRVVEVVPLWPNLQEIPKILGATVETVAAAVSRRPAGRWTSSSCIEALKPGTKALYLNSPNNPTGWTVTRERAEGDPRALPQARHLDLRRRRLRAPLSTASEGIAPSFLDICWTRTTALISTNTFSKSWLMTGWRLGWLVVPRGPDRRPGQADRVQHLLRAGVRAARRHRRGEGGRAGDRAHALALPQGARFPGRASCRKSRGVEVARARRDDVRVLQGRRRDATASRSARGWCASTGSASRPGSAFGPEGEGFVRWCFAASEEKLADGVARLKRALAR